MPAAGAPRAIRSAILVVDNEPVVVGFLTTALGLIGYEVIPAIGGAQARALFNLYAAELALMAVELVLPDMSGPEFVRTLPTLEPRIPVLYLTCLGEYETPPLDPATPVLRKPFFPSELKDTIQRITLRRR